MSKRKIYFRADGNSKIGLGHVIRSLALAEMVNKEFDCFFIIQNPYPHLADQIKKVCKDCITLKETHLATDIQKSLWCGSIEVFIEHIRPLRYLVF